MKNTNRMISAFFENLASAIYDRYWLSIFIVLVFGVFTILPITKISVETSAKSILESSDPAIKKYNEFREQFGTDNFIVVAIESPDIFSIEFIRKFNRLHKELRDHVPYLEDITSLSNIKYIKGFTNNLFVFEPFLIGFARNGEESKEMKKELEKKVLSNSLIRNIYVSEDGRCVTVLMRTKFRLDAPEKRKARDRLKEGSHTNKRVTKKYLNYDEKNKTVIAVREILKKYEAKNFKIHITGTDMIAICLKEIMTRDIKVFVILCLLVICLLLFFMFKRVSGVFIPLIIIVLTMLSTIGIMAYTGKPIRNTSQIIPSFLLAVCVCDSVHIFAIFYHQLFSCKNKKQAIVYAFGHSGLPVFLTTVTTVAGLLSFTAAQLSPIVDVGIFASIGVFIGYFYTVLIIPALIAVLPINTSNDIITSASIAGNLSQPMHWIAYITTHHPKKIIAVSSLITGFSIYGASTVRFTHDILSWFPENDPIRIATERIDEKLKGTVNLEVLIDTRKENGILDSAFLDRVDRAIKDMETLKMDDIYIGKAISISELIKTLHMAAHHNHPDFYKIPMENSTISEEFKIFKKSAGKYISSFTDDTYRTARFTMKVPFKESHKYSNLLNFVQSYFEKHFIGMNICLTGVVPILVVSSERASQSIKRSYAIAFIAISVLMVVLIDNLLLGLLSMIPNLLPVVFAFGIMGNFGIAVDAFAMMAGSIALGLAVDDTIHFMHVYRNYYDETKSSIQAINATLQTTGKAMFATTVLISCGFFVFLFSKMNNISNFGMIAGIMIITALLADYFIVSSLITLFHHEKISGS